MPHKAFFTQGVSVLFAKPPSLDELAKLLAARAPTRVDDMLVIETPLGKLFVDAAAHAFPDAMDDPETAAAWSMGFFGPCAWPRNLKRAAEHATLCKKAAKLVDRHRGYARLRLNGTPANKPTDELALIVAASRDLLAHRDALAYFNPSGECVRDRAALDDGDAFARRNDIVPLTNYFNARAFQVEGDWMLADIVGMGQVDRFDHEAVFQTRRHKLTDVVGFLRVTTNYTLDAGEVIEDTNTMDDPNGLRWRALRVEKALVAPERPTLRWFPLDGSRAPDSFL